MRAVRFAGHAIHPMLIVLPLGLLTSSVVFDILMLATYSPSFATIAYWNIGLGVLAALFAAVFGFADWLGIPGGTRAKRLGAWHAIANVTMVALFALSWLLRRHDPLHVPSDAALALSWGGVLLSLISGWLGGELVERHGMTIHEDAALDAPSSLSAGEPGFHRGEAGASPARR